MNDITFPLSEIQKAYYIGRGESFELGGKSTQITYMFETEMKFERLEQAVNKEIHRQPMLRAVILSENEQKILENVEYYKLKKIDFSEMNADQLEQAVIKEKEISFSINFSPDKWPLFEWKYIVTGTEKNYLIISFDLLIADGSSLMTLANEVRMFYDGRGDELPHITKTYRNYIEDKENKRKRKKYLADKEYWMNKIDEIPPAPKLSYLKTRSPEIKGNIVKRAVIHLKADDWKLCLEKSEAENISPTITVLTAYSKVLDYWSEDSNFTINMTITEHKRNNMQNVLGDYTSSLLIPVEDDLFSAECFWDSAKKLNSIFRNSYRHSSFEGVEIIKEISKQRNMVSMSAMPIVFTSLLFKNGLYDKIHQLGKLMDAISKTPQVIIDCQIEENNDSLVITWDYVEEYIDEKTITRMQEQMKTILLHSIHNIDDLDIDSVAFALTPEEKNLWSKYNDTDDNSIKDKSLIEMFINSVKKHPKNIAVSDSKTSYNYAQANEISDKIAVYLRKKGVVKGECVAVIVNRETATILNILGILKIGATYVPIAPDIGEKRKNYIINNADCKVVLNGPIDFNSINISNNSFKEWNDDYSNENAYIIYTSGTTGSPKGVVITNKAVANTIQDINQRLNITDKDKIIGLSSMTFDLSVYDIFGAFNAGAELVVMNDNKDPKQIRKVLIEKKITVWNSVPSIFELFLSFVKSDEKFYDLRNVLLSGDWISLHLPEKIRKCFPKCELYSLGGATEASIWSIMYSIQGVNPDWRSIPYGYPMKNQKIYVVDIKGNLCPVSVPGEICIGGKGLAIGYQNDPKRTAQSFVTSPLLGDIYKTGDLGVMDINGYVRIIGRMDHQLKINGYRIETDEIISTALRYSNDIKNAMVIPMYNCTQLCCFLETSSKINEVEFLTYLSSQLPPYMVPTKTLCLENLPLTSNGKISRKKLEKLAEEISQVEIISPRTETEKMLYEVWKSVLEKEDISINQSFFELGGDSIKAAEVFGILEDRGCQIEIATLFRNNTIEKLAQVIDEGSVVQKEILESGEL